MPESTAVEQKLDLLTIPKVVDQLLATETNPRHRAILSNYRRHVLLEVSGRWPEILVPEMTVPHPVYHMVFADQSLVFDGAEAVAGHYRGLADAGMAVSCPIEERLAVADWGMVSDARYAQVVPAASLVAQGIPVDDEDGTYRLISAVVTVWRFDENAKLLGEHIYANAGAMRIEPADPSEIISTEQAAKLLAPLLNQPA